MSTTERNEYANNSNIESSLKSMRNFYLDNVVKQHYKVNLLNTNSEKSIYEISNLCVL